MNDSLHLKFGTEIITLAKISDKLYSIPTYQRPYVWGNEEIIKLLDGFYQKFDTEKEEPYYLGTVLVKENEGCFDLIDGQQRFTTLWLTAVVFKKLAVTTELTNFLETDSKLRLSFEIRDEVEKYLKSLLGVDTDAVSSETIESLPYLKNISRALATIEGKILLIDKDKQSGFADYIYSKVCLVKNSAPDNIDLNKLFSTINSSGIQLEQTDIVKHNLLRHLKDEKVLYSKIWEACENMDTFFERSVRTVFSASEWKTLDLSKHQRFDKDKFKYESSSLPQGNEGSFCIDDLKPDDSYDYEPDSDAAMTEADRWSDGTNCRSIINFGQLLLHTFRIHLKRENSKDFEGTFHIERLITIFGEMDKRGDAAEIKRFLKLLWDVRYVFDKYIIKWITDTDSKEEHLELVAINRKEEDGYYSRRAAEKSDMLMLQSVLYFTGDYLRQYWLTPYISYLLDHSDKMLGSPKLLDRLEAIDNQLSICTEERKLATFTLMGGTLKAEFDFKSYLKQSKGTKFFHYWFYKLEYLLWKNWDDRSDEKFKAYRITSKNSVEHIFPQSKAAALGKVKDDFGNLVLLSVSQNSEYSNKEVNVKKTEFYNKKTYDTLKSHHVFKNAGWGATEIGKHQEAMIAVIASHYQ